MITNKNISKFYYVSQCKTSDPLGIYQIQPYGYNLH